MVKYCTSEYGYEVVKNCKFMRLLKSGEPRCDCTKNCAMCTVGSGRGMIYMHPELHAKYIADQAISTKNIKTNTSDKPSIKVKSLRGTLPNDPDRPILSNKKKKRVYKHEKITAKEKAPYKLIDGELVLQGGVPTFIEGEK